MIKMLCTKIGKFVLRECHLKLSNNHRLHNEITQTTILP